MRRRSLLAATAAVAAPGFVRAQPSGWQATFDRWAHSASIQEATLAVMRGGRLA